MSVTVRHLPSALVELWPAIFCASFFPLFLRAHPNPFQAIFLPKSISFWDQNYFRARQRSGEGVVRGNGRPKGCFWGVRFFSVPLRFALKTSENLKGTEETDSPKTPFWTTVSPHDALPAPLARPHYSFHGVTTTVRGWVLGRGLEGVTPPTGKRNSFKNGERKRVRKNEMQLHPLFFKCF